MKAVVALALGMLLATGLAAQTPQQPASPPSPPQSQPKPPTEANPFPEDTGNVPVMPDGKEPAPAASPSSGEDAIHAPVADNDPVRSPDEPEPDISGSSSGESSSSAGIMDRIQPPPDADTRGKHGKGQEPPAQHSESAAEDISVGAYYLSNHSWKAALSRFQSALVLDPENPEVYWGLAEAERHTGDFSAAKANYLKLLEYDPDGKHGKEARKNLKDPEVANAPASASVPH